MIEFMENIKGVKESQDLPRRMIVDIDGVRYKSDYYTLREIKDEEQAADFLRSLGVRKVTNFLINKNWETINKDTPLEIEYEDSSDEEIEEEGYEEEFKSEDGEGYVKVICEPEDGFIYISRHALKRLKERNGWSKRTALRMVRKILENGEDLRKKKGYLKQWFQRKCRKEGIGEDIEYILFGGNLYIIKNQILVTVFDCPKKERIYRTF